MDKTINRLLILLIVIAVNVLSIYYYYRWDVTRSKAYSLSVATKNIINQLQEPVKIRLFFSSKLPPQIENVKKYTRDLLTEYQNYSKGKLYFEFINPDSEEKFTAEARLADISPKRVEVYEENSVEMRDIYMGMSILYGERLDLIPYIADTQGLEYSITSILKKMINPTQRHIAYFQQLQEWEGYNENYLLPIPENIATLYSMVSDETTTILDRADLFRPLPASTDLLIVNASTDSLHFVQLYNIDQFIMQGKPVIIFADRYIADPNNSPAVLFDNELMDLLRFWGIYVKPNLVMDAFCMSMSTYTMQNNVIVPLDFNYPFYPIFSTFADTLSLAYNLKEVRSYFTSEIHYARKDLKNTPIMLTSSVCSEIGGDVIDIDHRRYSNIDYSRTFFHNPKPVMNLFTGSFDSVFAETETKKTAGFIPKTTSGVVVVAGTTSLLDNELLRYYFGNRSLILNLIDYLTGNEDFIYMRNRNISYSPLKELPTYPYFKNIVKYGNLALPVCLVFIGAVVFRVVFRRHQRKIADSHQPSAFSNTERQ